MLQNIIQWLADLLGSYGWAMIVFTLLVRLVLMPFDYKSRVGMRKTAMIQPKMAELQKKYSKDPEKLNRKMSELYKQEGVSPLSGCLPMLLSYPILILMFNAMRAVANEQVVHQVIAILQNPDTMPRLESWLWIKNIWAADSPFVSVMPTLQSLQLVPADIWTKLMTSDIIATLPGELSKLTAESFASGSALTATIQQIYAQLGQCQAFIDGSAVMQGLGTVRILGLISVTIYQQFNGLFILPLFSAASQLLMTKLTPAAPTPAAADSQQAAAQSTTKFMQWFFPIFTLWICSTSNGSFALYWVTSNLIAMAQTWLINKYLDKKDKEAAQKVSLEGNVK